VKYIVANASYVVVWTW